MQRREKPIISQFHAIGNDLRCGLVFVWVRARANVSSTYLMIIWLCLFGVLIEGVNCAIFALTDAGGIKGRLLYSAVLGVCVPSSFGSAELDSYVFSCPKAAALNLFTRNIITYSCRHSLPRFLKFPIFLGFFVCRCSVIFVYRVFVLFFYYHTKWVFFFFEDSLFIRYFAPKSLSHIYEENKIIGILVRNWYCFRPLDNESKIFD